jgi:microcin C transport system ATP-binding protein
LDLNLLKKNKLKNIRKDIQIVFQDPFSSLSPRMNVQEILNEGIDVHFPQYSLLEKKQILKDILKETGMDYDEIIINTLMSSQVDRDKELQLQER